MTDIQCTSTQLQLIAVNRLAKSPLNARKTPVTIGMEELKASILAYGLMQNLVVTDRGDGTYLVIAGGRRLEAIHFLQAEGKLPNDFAVPCQIVTEEYALEMSLAENTVRLAMHPADQFEAFATLIEQGKSAADVAVRFGVEESFVLKRMKLARVAPELLAEYRNEGMTLECLMAYTVTDDHRKQMKVFKALQGWQKEDPNAIRAALTEKMIEASDKLARFVGLDAYVAAGGSTRSDLFGQEVYLENPALLHKLAEGKLVSIRKELEAEGWGWVEINPERDYDAIHRCGRLKPQLIGVPAELIAFKSQLDAELESIENDLEDTESDALLERQEAVQKRLEEVEQQLAAYVGFDATQKRLAGCFVSIGHDGSLHFDKGLVKPEDRKLVARVFGDDEGITKAVRAKPKDALPESLRCDLAIDRLQVAKVAIASHPAIALDLLTFRVASTMLGRQRVTDGPNVEFKLPKPGKERELWAADHDLDAIRKALPIGWLKGKTEAARFEEFCTLPQESRYSLFAYCTAQTLQPKLGPSEANEATAYDAALSKTSGQVAASWRPSKGNFLGRITRDRLLAVGGEVFGEDWAQAHANDKKGHLVDQLDRAFANPDKSGRTLEQIEKLKHWLPKGMSFDLESSATTKAKKARKVA